MRERILTSKKFEVRRLKTFSYEAGVSELYAWLADETMIILRQKGSQHQENPKTLIRVSQRLFNLANEIYLA